MRSFLRLLFFLIFLTGAVCFGVETDSEALQARLKQLQKENQQLREQAEQKADQIEKLQAELASLQSPPPAKPKEKPPVVWEREIAMGGTVTSGNRDAYLFNLKSSNVRTTAKDKLALGLNADIAEENQETTAQRIEGNVDYNRQVSGRVYWQIKETLLHDQVSGIDYRNTFSPGLGYHILDEEDLKLSVEAGPAYVLRRLEGESMAHSGQFRVGEDFSWQFHPRWKLIQTVEWLANMERVGDYLAEAEVSLETDLWSDLHLRLTLRDRYQNEPPADKKKNDLAFLTSLIWKF